ncbi:hypothetical protein O181_023922 [Austropuccinia psidii MF-1]|uniref:Uncharacterized protein n=1 Tax=Austropuccinia psidii MF-1 TaxID=1389203 RepID=A0A9Q3CI92_9BASI|nr:hypothetical protein [Austropuccinia psidii MF-1]
MIWVICKCLIHSDAEVGANNDWPCSLSGAHKLSYAPPTGHTQGIFTCQEDLLHTCLPTSYLLVCITPPMIPEAGYLCMGICHHGSYARHSHKPRRSFGAWLAAKNYLGFLDYPISQSTQHIFISPQSPEFHWPPPWHPFQDIDTIPWGNTNFHALWSWGAWIENFQANPTQTLFVEGVFMTDPNDPCSSQKPNLALMFLTGYPNILFIIESFRKQDFKPTMPKEYDCNTHSQCQLCTPTFPASNSIPPSYPALFSLTSEKKLIQLPGGSDLPMMTPPQSIIQTALLPHQKTGLAFLWD